MADVAVRRGFPRIRLEHGAYLVVVLALIYLVITPLARLILDTFSPGGGFSLDAFYHAFVLTPDVGTMMLNSLIFAFGSTVVALLIGTTLAFLYVRTDVPLRRLILASALVPMIVPGIIYAASWAFLGDPKVGLLNQLIFQPLFGASPVNVFSMGGMIWVQGLSMTPLCFLLLLPAFQAVDPSLEEGAMMAGANPAQTFRRIVLPLLRPAVVSASLLMFVQSLESFEVPTLLGPPNGIYVFTSQIYYKITSYPTDFASAGAYSIALLVIAMVGVGISTFMLRNARRYQTISGKAFRPRVAHVSKGRWLASGFIAAYFLVAVVAPLATIVYTSMLRFYAAPSAETLRTMTFDNYVGLFANSSLVKVIGNTVIVGISAAVIVMLISTVAAWISTRSKIRGRGVIDALAFTPIVIPGLVLGVALAFVYLRLPLPIYGTLVILIIAYVTRCLPFAMRYSSSALGQISQELEESAHMSGASWFATFRRIIMPLSSGGILAGFIFVVLVAFRELSSTILLYSPGSEVFSIFIWQQYQAAYMPQVAATGVIVTLLLLLLVLAIRAIGGRFGLAAIVRAG